MRLFLNIATVSPTLMASPPRFSDHTLQLINLSLRTSKRPKLPIESALDRLRAASKAYPLLRQLARPLIFAVPQQFDHTTLIRGKAVRAHSRHISPSSFTPLYHLGLCGIWTYPDTSLTISLTKAVRLLRWPLVREMRGLDSRGVTFCRSNILVSLHSISSHASCLLPMGSKWKQGIRTWPLFRPTAMPLFCLTAIVIACRRVD